MPPKSHVVVAGGGVIGLALAWRLRQGGAAVTVMERGECGGGASAAAAGLLEAAPPVTETHPGLLDLTRPAHEGYPDFVRELEYVSGRPVGLGRRGVLLASLSAEDDAYLDRREAFLRSLDLPSRRLDGAGARWKEQALSPDARGALLCDKALWLNPRALCAALAEAVRRSGGRICEREEVVEIETSAGRVAGVRTGSRTIAADAIVVAAGGWSSRLLSAVPAGTGAAAGAPRIFPVRGQALSLENEGGSFVQRPVRSPEIWVVPQNDGRLAVGATIEDAGFDARPRAWAVAKLLAAVERLLPGARDLPFREAYAGLRPGSPDGLPWIGPSPTTEGLFLATGHYRAGILLAPITARLLADLILRGERAPSLKRFAPGRATPTATAPRSSPEPRA
jgi:glycine oxidase